MESEQRIILVMFIIISILIFTNCLVFAMYKESIKAGAKNTVTALEMVVACQSVSNITQEQLIDEYYKIFIKPKLNASVEVE